MELGNRALAVTARLLAFEAHEGIMWTSRSGARRPQTVHLQEVADLVWACGGSEEEIAAAWLHDSLEDTHLTSEEISLHCGDTIAHHVRALTDYDDWLALPLLERKKLQAQRVRSESSSVQKVKLADQISNVRAVVLDPPDFMDDTACRDYILGAKEIAAACKGVNPLLDSLFERACVGA